jgi:2-dehydro-3-deoxyphosphogluconate aldolase / (4S)-4-hydroxy-2-oxoglutarate aldolase
LAFVPMFTIRRESFSDDLTKHLNQDTIYLSKNSHTPRSWSSNHERSHKMSKQETIERIRQLGLLAVIRGPSPELTIQMVEALVAGGVLGIEITYSTPSAAQVVKALDGKFGSRIVLGMGTLTLPEQAEEAKTAGARFIVSPHFEQTLAQAMISTGLAVMLGALTPSEVFAAYRLGADVVKIFPGSLVGPDYIKALHGPFPQIPMTPTGGVTEDNITEWFAAGALFVGAGSNLCPPSWAKEGRFADITAQARRFVEAVDRARGNK